MVFLTGFRDTLLSAVPNTTNFHQPFRDAETTVPRGICIRFQQDVPYLVEVRGIEPRSLSNQIKVATCLACLLFFAPKNSGRQDFFRTQPFLILSCAQRAKAQDQPVTALTQPPGRLSEAHPLIKERDLCASRNQCWHCCYHWSRAYYYVVVGVCIFARCFTRPPCHLGMLLLPDLPKSSPFTPLTFFSSLFLFPVLPPGASGLAAGHTISCPDRALIQSWQIRAH